MERKFTQKSEYLLSLGGIGPKDISMYQQQSQGPQVVWALWIMHQSDVEFSTASMPYMKQNPLVCYKKTCLWVHYLGSSSCAIILGHLLSPLSTMIWLYEIQECPNPTCGLDFLLAVVLLTQKTYNPYILYYCMMLCTYYYYLPFKRINSLKPIPGSFYFPNTWIEIQWAFVVWLNRWIF